MDPDLWNVLHDGELTAAERAAGGGVRLSVEIAYLRDHLPTAARHLVVTLAGCDSFAYHPYDCEPVVDPAAAGLRPTLLSALVVHGEVCVECADGGAGGQLRLRYASAGVATAEGRPLSQAELEAAAQEYWTRWEAGNRAAAAAPEGSRLEDTR